MAEEDAAAAAGTTLSPPPPPLLSLQTSLDASVHPDPSLLWRTLHTSTMPPEYLEWGLARARAAPHSVDAAGFFCMMAGKGQVDVCRQLVGECGVWPNVPSPNDPEKLQALHLAASEGRQEVVRYLVLECGRKQQPQPQSQHQQQHQHQQ